MAQSFREAHYSTPVWAATALGAILAVIAVGYLWLADVQARHVPAPPLFDQAAAPG